MDSPLTIPRHWQILSGSHNCVRCSFPEVVYVKVFLRILQNSQETNCARVSLLIELLAWGLLHPVAASVVSLFNCQFGIPEKWDRDPEVGPRTLWCDPRMEPWGGTWGDSETATSVFFIYSKLHCLVFIRITRSSNICLK